MTAALESTGSFMLSKEIEILMTERARLLRVAGAAAQFVAVMNAKKLPENVATEADILAESVNALYRGETVDADDLARVLSLFRLQFRDPADAIADLGGRPVYLGLACRPDRTLKMKPHNLLSNLPLNPVQ